MKSACAKKPESHTGFFGKWCACVTSLYLWPYVVRITSRAAVGWFRRRSRTTWPKNPNNTGEIGAGVYIGKKTLKNRWSFKKSHSGGRFFYSVFFAVFRGSCVATSHEKPECTKDSGFFDASVNGTKVWIISRHIALFVRTNILCTAETCPT